FGLPPATLRNWNRGERTRMRPRACCWRSSPSTPRRYRTCCGRPVDEAFGDLLRRGRPPTYSLNSANAPALPTHRLAPILLIQPLLQRGEVIQNRRRVHFALAGERF